MAGIGAIGRRSDGAVAGVESGSHEQWNRERAQDRQPVPVLDRVAEPRLPGPWKELRDIGLAEERREESARERQERDCGDPDRQAVGPRRGAEPACCENDGRGDRDVHGDAVELRECALVAVRPEE